MDLLPDDLLYYIVNQIDNIYTADKFRRLSNTTYLLTEKVEFNEIVCILDYQNYDSAYYANFKVIVTVNEDQITDEKLLDVYGITCLHRFCVNYLTKFNNLRYLDICKLYIKDIKELRYCTLLETLDLHSTNIEDISSLKYCTRLKKIDLFSTYVADISVLQYCTELEMLNLSFTQVSDISALSYCTKLKKLDLVYTNVKDISPLSYCTMLEKLDIYGVSILYTDCLNHIINLYISY